MEQRSSIRGVLMKLGTLKTAIKNNKYLSGDDFYELDKIIDDALLYVVTTSDVETHQQQTDKVPVISTNLNTSTNT